MQFVIYLIVCEKEHYKNNAIHVSTGDKNRVIYIYVCVCVCVNYVYVFLCMCI